MRFLDIVRLTEMNVANLDTIKADFAHLLDKTMADRQAPLARPLYDLIVKRAVKAMGNDDAGNMVTRRPVSAADLPDDAPAWLRTSVTRGDEVFEIAFKEGFANRLAHVLDWLRVDADAAKTIKATPEADFLGLLAQAADTYFAKASAEAAKQSDQSLDEPGRDVIMTFRRNPTTEQITLFQETDLAANPHGRVVMFWAKLTSPEALNREGRLMKHCVGSYADVVASERVVIYSLRDLKNEPHATVELNMNNGRAPSINQVKGKANQPPLGRYGVYIKDFLNTLGVAASERGARDVQGMGLLAHNGKFGTILDVGGAILAAFANGDTLRTLAVADVNSTSQWRPTKTPTYSYLYVEKDGTVPFSFDISIADNTAVTAVDTGTVANFRLLRKEVSRFPLYAKFIIDFLNRKRLKGATKTFEQIGVFYDGRNDAYGLWGTRADLTTHLFDYQGVTVSRIAEDVFFADAKGTMFATGQLVRNQFGSIKVINDCDAVSRLPDLLREIGNRVLKRQMPDKNHRDYFADYGVFWNNTKDLYTGLPEGRVIQQTKIGKISQYMHRLFFTDPAGTLIASYPIGTDSAPFEIAQRKLQVFSTAGRLALYKLFAAVTKDSTGLLAMTHFNTRELREDGYYIERQRLRPLSEVETDQPLGGGYTMAVRVADHGDKVVSLLKAGRAIATVNVDADGKATGVDYTIDDAAYRRGEVSVDAAALPAVAALLNAATVRMSHINLFRHHLQIKNNKYAALDPQKDALLLAFIQRRVKLEGGFEFRLTAYLERLGRDNDDQYTRFGYVQTEAGGDTVCAINWAEGSRDELAYHMTKRLPDGVSREQVIKVVAKFMHFYHAKVEPYMNTDLFMPSGKSKIAD